MSELQDTDPMPIGKAHLGKAMQDVPVDYLHYLWCGGLRTKNQKSACASDFSSKQCQVADYIKRNLAALKSEDRDLIWT